jgi:hypothetical protein
MLCSYHYGTYKTCEKVSEKARERMKHSCKLIYSSAIYVYIYNNTDQSHLKKAKMDTNTTHKTQARIFPITPGIVVRTALVPYSKEIRLGFSRERRRDISPMLMQVPWPEHLLGQPTAHVHAQTKTEKSFCSTNKTTTEGKIYTHKNKKNKTLGVTNGRNLQKVRQRYNNKVGLTQ